MPQKSCATLTSLILIWFLLALFDEQTIGPQSLSMSHQSQNIPSTSWHYGSEQPDAPALSHKHTVGQNQLIMRLTFISHELGSE